MTIFNDMDLILLKEHFYNSVSKEYIIITDFIEKISNMDHREVWRDIVRDEGCKYEYGKYFIEKQEFFDKALQLAQYNFKV